MTSSQISVNVIDWFTALNMITSIDWTLIYPFVISRSFDLWWLYCSFILTDCIVCLMYNDWLILLIVMCINIVYLLIELIDWLMMCIYCTCAFTDSIYWLIVDVLYFWYLLILLIDWLIMCICFILTYWLTMWIYCTMTIYLFDWLIVGIDCILTDFTDSIDCHLLQSRTRDIHAHWFWLKHC